MCGGRARGRDNSDNAVHSLLFYSTLVNTLYESKKPIFCAFRVMMRFVYEEKLPTYVST